MSDHKKPLTALEESGLIAHRLPIGKPSQLADAFRHGIAWAERARPAPVSQDAWLVEAERLVIAFRKSILNMRDDSLPVAEFMAAPDVYMKTMQNLFAHLRSRPEPEGFVLVPIEPTKAMLQAAWDECSQGSASDYADCYKAMIAATERNKP